MEIPLSRHGAKKSKYIDSAISISPDGFLKGKYVYENDEQGKRLVHSHFTPDGTLTYKYTNSYDANGNLSEVTHYTSDSSVSSKRFYVYNEENHLVEEKEVDGSGKQTFRIEYEYKDPEGKIKLGDKYSVLTEYDGNDIPQIQREYSYDSWGNIVLQVADNFTSEVRFESIYKYDDKGNWYQTISKRNGVITDITERKFNTDVPENLKNLQKTAVPDRSIPEVLSSGGSKPGFPVENILDGNPATAWLSEYSDSGHLPSLYFNFQNPKDIDILVISNGFIQDDNSWVSYGKLETVFIDFPNNTQGWIQYKLNPRMKKQIIPIHQKKLSSLQLILGSAVPGTKSSYIAISDVWFY
jgi:hypothetical protein